MSGANKKLVVIDLHPESISGGAERIFRGLAREALASGYDVKWFGASFEFYKLVHFVYSAIGSKASPYQDSEDPLAGVNILRFRFSMLVPFTKGWRDARACLREADRIICKNEFLELLVLYYFGGQRALRRTLVSFMSALSMPSSVQGPWRLIHDALYRNPFYRWALRQVYGVHGLCESVRDDLEYVGTPQVCVRVLGCPVWSDETSAQPGAEFNVLYVGRLTEQKGIQYLLRVAELLRPYPIAIDVAGSGDQEPLVRQAAEDLGNIRFHGYTPDPASLYRQASVAIVPSRWETFGMTTAEAVSMGVRAVAFDIPGPREVLQVAGLEDDIIPRFHAEKMAERVLKHYRARCADPVAYARSMQLAAQAVRNVYEPRRVFRRVLEAL